MIALHLRAHPLWMCVGEMTGQSIRLFLHAAAAAAAVAAAAAADSAAATVSTRRMPLSPPFTLLFHMS